MRISYSAPRSRFEAQTAYGEPAAAQVKAAGWRWDSDVKRWHTANPTIVSPFISVADEAAKAALETAKAALASVLAASRATDAAIIVPAPEGLSYLGYQKAGVAYAMGRKDTLIADEPGLGKTIQALGVANTMLAGWPEARRIKMLVVGPKISLWNWRREAEKWLTRQHTVEIWTASKQPTADIVIVNYDVLSRPAVAAALRAVSWDLAVFDEAHALKNATSARTKAVLGHRKDGIEPIRASRRLFLTGTPILNRPIELQPVLASMGVPEAKSWHAYATRYCAGHQTRFGWDVSGASNMPELQELLRRSVMVRRLKADVLSELPAKRYSVVELAADTADLRRAVSAEVKAAAAADAETARLRAATERAKSGGDMSAYRLAVSALRRGRSAHFAEMSKLRHATAVAKVPAVVEHLVSLLEGSDESVLVMAHHADVIAGIEAGLREAGYAAAVITGATSDADRQKAQDDIQSRRKRVFVGSMRACGVAITLTAASTVVFAEQDWTPGIMSQAEDRAHRIGQTDKVLVQHLVVDGSMDATMARTVAEKGGIIDAALDDYSDVADEDLALAA